MTAACDIVPTVNLHTVATGRGEFLDVGLGIALINFVSTCAFAAFLARKDTDQ